MNNVIYDTLFSLAKRNVIHAHIIALRDKAIDCKSVVKKNFIKRTFYIYKNK